MKTSTKVKIGCAILICLLLLAAIAKKTRENFQAEINAQNISDSMMVFGNRNPEEVSPSEMEVLGYKILETDENITANLDTKQVNPRDTHTCSLSNKTDEERTLSIQRDAIQAKQQLDDYLKKEIENKNNSTNNYNKNNNEVFNACNVFKFPAILS